MKLARAQAVSRRPTAKIGAAAVKIAPTKMAFVGCGKNVLLCMRNRGRVGSNTTTRTVVARLLDQRYENVQRV